MDFCDDSNELVFHNGRVLLEVAARGKLDSTVAMHISEILNI